MTPEAFEAARGYPTSTVHVQKLNDYATVPTYGSNGAAGMDLYANLSGEKDLMDEMVTDREISIKPGERRLIKTGIAIAIPQSTYARIAPRSGLAYKHGIDVMAGVIDEDYRGDLGVILINHGDKPFDVKHGDRIAQLIVTHYLATCPVVVSDLGETVRGTGGFGSTGK